MGQNATFFDDVICGWLQKDKKESGVEEKEDGKKAPKKLEDLSEKDQERQKRIEKLTSILSGHKTIYLHLQLLMRNDKTDPLILKGTKDAVRVSICHTATVIANGFMHCGTTHDSFLRDNLDWLARATNWAKLSATASLGVIHRGHESGSLSLMQSYLPKVIQFTYDYRVTILEGNNLPSTCYCSYLLPRQDGRTF